MWRGFYVSYAELLGGRPACKCNTDNDSVPFLGQGILGFHMFTSPLECLDFTSYWPSPSEF